MLLPVARDIDAAGNPDSLVRRYVVEKTYQRCDTPGASDES